jgi:hypothetical protein
MVDPRLRWVGRGLGVSQLGLLVPVGACVLKRDVPFWAVALGVAVHLLGQCVCLVSGRSVRGRPFLAASAALSGAGLLVFPGSLLLYAYTDWQPFREQESLLALFAALFTVLGIAAFCYFVALVPQFLFLWKLAGYVQEDGLARSARRMLLLWTILVAVLLSAAGAGYLGSGSERVLVVCVLVILASLLVAAFAMLGYWNLLNGLRQAAEKQAAYGPVPQ